MTMSISILFTIIIFLSLALVGAIIKEAELTKEIMIIKNRCEGD